ncbi:MAG: hypothetical protein SVV03_02195 [Candidatus Nanohaloarchaea archaeon]|nr:hypothetical protein [Candidatus Nanohaloarchaea archaeon]
MADAEEIVKKHLLNQRKGGLVKPIVWIFFAILFFATVVFIAFGIIRGV